MENNVFDSIKIGLASPEQIRAWSYGDVYKRQANVFYVRIDKNRKLPVTVLCRALGLSTNEDILNFFGDDERILATLEKDTTKNQDEGLLEVYRKLRPGEPPTVESATSQIDMLFFDPRRYDPVSYTHLRRLGARLHYRHCPCAGKRRGGHGAQRGGITSDRGLRPLRACVPAH